MSIRNTVRKQVLLALGEHFLGETKRNCNVFSKVALFPEFAQTQFRSDSSSLK